MPFNLFGKRGNLKRLQSSEEIDLSTIERDFVEVDKKEGDLALTLGNTDDGSGVLVVAIGEPSICTGKVKPGQVIFKVNEHDVGTHSEAVALMDKAANGIVRLELSKLAADDETVDMVAKSPHKSMSKKNLFE